MLCKKSEKFIFWEQCLDFFDKLYYNVGGKVFKRENRNG